MNNEDVGCVCVCVCVCVCARAHRHTLEYYAAMKKNEILLFATTCMDLESIMLSEISQRGKEMPYGLVSLICGTKKTTTAAKKN